MTLTPFFSAEMEAMTKRMKELEQMLKKTSPLKASNKCDKSADTASQSSALQTVKKNKQNSHRKEDVKIEKKNKLSVSKTKNGENDKGHNCAKSCSSHGDNPEVKVLSTPGQVTKSAERLNTSQSGKEGNHLRTL